MTLANKNKKTADIDQHRRFIETARELGCDDDEAAFDAKLKKVAGHKPAPSLKTDAKKSDLKR